MRNVVKLAGYISMFNIVLSNQDSVPMAICGWCVAIYVASDSRFALIL